MQGSTFGVGAYYGFGRYGLGTCVNGTDDQTGMACDSGSGGTGGQGQQCVSTGCDLQPGQTTDNCGNLCPDTAPKGTPTCYAYGSDNSCLSYTTDGGATIIGCGTSTTGPCAPQAGSAPTGSGGGSLTPPVNSNSFAQFFASIGKALTGSTVAGANTAAACAAAKGTWTGTTCAPAGSIAIGGVALSMPMLLLLGGGLLLLTKRR